MKQGVVGVGWVRVVPGVRPLRQRLLGGRRPSHDPALAHVPISYYVMLCYIIVYHCIVSCIVLYHSLYGIKL